MNAKTATRKTTPERPSMRTSLLHRQFRLPAHETTSAHLAGAWPWLAGGGSSAGPFLGNSMIDGSAWGYSPQAAYAAGDVTGPNVVINGQVGKRKSSLVKVMCAYAVGMLGGRVVICDPKGEYQPLAAYFGYHSVRPTPGGGVRLNLLDGDRATLPAVVAGIARSALDRPLNQIEEAGLTGALSRELKAKGTDVHLGHVAEAVLLADSETADELGYCGADAIRQLRDDTREAGLALRHLVNVALPGVINGPTTPGLRDGRLLVLDLSTIADERALRVMMAAAMRWSAATTSGGNGLLVVDEAWRVLADPGSAEAAQAAWKLARARGVAGVAVLHRVSDLDAVGPAGSKERAIAYGLVADSETRITFAQDPGEAQALANIIGLSDREVGWVTSRLPRGCALWRVGRRPSTPVEHKVPKALLPILDTDQNMRAA